ncbi:transcriptional regulator [Bacillus sp. Root147]|nr:transcriptional regulator [Bacillus sp. Root147]
MSNKFQQVNDFSMGRLTSLLVLLHNTELAEGIEKEINERGYSYTVGKVGAMELSKVVAAIETSAKTNKIINAQSYREVHALYHTILEAIQGVSRGTLQLGDILRTVGLTFSIVRGKIEFSGSSDEWISVCVYGTIGAPKKGFEHDTLGFGFNHI